MITAFIIIIAIVASLGYAIGMHRGMQEQKEKDGAPITRVQLYALDAIPHILRKLRCEFTEEKSESGESIIFDFTFQISYFRLICEKNSYFPQLIFPSIFKFGEKSLQQVKTLCNIVNQAEKSKLVYTYDEEEKVIFLHLMQDIVITGQDEFNVDLIDAYIKNFFKIRERIYQLLDNIREECDNDDRTHIKGFSINHPASTEEFTEIEPIPTVASAEV